MHILHKKHLFIIALAFLPMANSFAMKTEHEETRASQLLVLMNNVLKKRLPEEELSPEKACIDSLCIFSQNLEQIPERDNPDFEQTLNQAYIYGHYNAPEALNVLVSLAYGCTSSEGMSQTKDFWEKKSFSFCALPMESLVHIFEFMDIRDVPACVSVCHEWEDCVAIAFRIYINFAEKFIEVGNEVGQNLTPENALEVLQKFRVAGEWLYKNQPGTNKRENYIRVVMTLSGHLLSDMTLMVCSNPMLWAANRDKRIVRGLYEGQKFINIKPIWFNLALIRASDSFIEGFADSILDKIPAIQYLGYARANILGGPMAQALIMMLQGQRVDYWREVGDDNIFIELIASDVLLKQRISSTKNDIYTEVLRLESEHRNLKDNDIDLHNCLLF